MSLNPLVRHHPVRSIPFKDCQQELKALQVRLSDYHHKLNDLRVKGKKRMRITMLKSECEQMSARLRALLFLRKTK